MTIKRNPEALTKAVRRCFSHPDRRVSKRFVNLARKITARDRKTKNDGTPRLPEGKWVRAATGAQRASSAS